MALGRRLRALALGALGALVLAPALGCGHGSSSSTDSTSGAVASDRVYVRHRKRVGSFDSSSGARSMGLSSESGVYDAADVDDVMRENFGEIRSCYAQGGRPRGRITLRFAVDATGKPTDVAIVEGKSGNHTLERCLFRVSMNLRFPPPIGNKPATFEYPIEVASRARSNRAG